jgi:putative acetyltransferase
MILRSYRPSDAPVLLALFRETVRRINARDYNPEQIQAWASEEIDPSVWEDRFRDRFAIVAEEGDVIAGFTELEPDGHIDRFFVSAEHQGMGVGRGLMDRIVAEAHGRGLPRLYLEASITARTFFERQGFVVLGQQTVTVRGVDFLNYRMERRLQ